MKQQLSYGGGNRHGDLKTKTDEMILKRMRFFFTFDDANLPPTKKTMASQSSSNVYIDIAQPQASSDISCVDNAHLTLGGSSQSNVRSLNIRDGIYEHCPMPTSLVLTMRTLRMVAPCSRTWASRNWKSLMRRSGRSKEPITLGLQWTHQQTDRGHHVACPPI